MVLPEAELIAPLNTAGRVKGMEIKESEFAGRLRLVKPTGSVAAEVVPDVVSRVIGRVVPVVGRTVVVVTFGFETTCPSERDAPANEMVTAPNSTAEEKRVGSFMVRLTRSVFMAEVAPENKRFRSLIRAKKADFCKSFVERSLRPNDCRKRTTVYLPERLPCPDFLPTFTDGCCLWLLSSAL